MRAPPDRPTSPGTPRLLRALNERAVLDRLRRDGPRSRPQLAQDTGLSKPTVSSALANLKRAGLVREVGRAIPTGGRSAQLYEPDPTAAYVVGIDIGRDWIRVAVADLAGELVGRNDTRNRARSGQTLVRDVGALAHELVAEVGVEWEAVAHSVVGSPGVFDPANGRMRHAPNLPGWGRPGLAEALGEVLPPSVTIENDANLAAIGEGAYGRARGAEDFVYVSVGTGVGMGVVIGGTLYRGFGGAAGEVAYVPLAADGSAPVESGRRWGGAREPVRPERKPARAARQPPRGILEEATAAGAIVRTARALGMKGRLDSKRIFDAARAGDPLARATVDAEAERLALVVATVAAILDPQLILLGGGVGGNVDLLRPRLEERLRELTPLEPRIEEGELGHDAIVLGAVTTALGVAHELIFDQRAGSGQLAAKLPGL